MTIAVNKEIILDRMQTLIDNLHKLLLSYHYSILVKDATEAEGFIFNLYILKIIEKEDYEIYHRATTKYRTLGESEGKYYIDTELLKLKTREEELIH